jgi:hypothetical protein
LKPKNNKATLSRDPLRLCGKMARCIIFWAEILGVIKNFHPTFDYYASPECLDYVHDWSVIPEHLDVDTLGRTADFEEARIWVEAEDIMWTVTVLDTRYTCYYTQLSQFANQLLQGQRQ